MTQTALTREQVLKASGAELDVMVAVHIFKEPVAPLYLPMVMRDKTYYFIPEYSTDISAAWEVTEHMRKTHWSTLDSGLKVINRPEVKPFICSFGKYGIPGTSVYAEADKAPEAICKAALLAVLDI